MSGCGCLPGSPENGWHEERSAACQREESEAFARSINAGIAWAREHLIPADSGRRVRVHAHPLGEPCPPSCAHSTEGQES